jgi:hypothetical protein
MLRKLIPAVIGYVLFALFAGYLALRLGEPPLLVIVGVVLAMCLADFVHDLRT